MAMTVEINVFGCDDATTIQLDVTDEEAAFLDKVAGLITKASTYKCQPTMTTQQVIILDTK